MESFCLFPSPLPPPLPFRDPWVWLWSAAGNKCTWGWLRSAGPGRASWGKPLFQLMEWVRLSPSSEHVSCSRASSGLCSWGVWLPALTGFAGGYQLRAGGWQFCTVMWRGELHQTRGQGGRSQWLHCLAEETSGGGLWWVWCMPCQICYACLRTESLVFPSTLFFFSCNILPLQRWPLLGKQ